MSQFESQKMDDSGISNELRNKFASQLNKIKSSTIDMFNNYIGCLDDYNKAMSKSLNECDTYLKPNQFNDIHKKSISISKLKV